jgi:predicted nuclease of predicted toxin-antitoxin system
MPQNYSESTSIKKENLLNALDREIWEYAKKNQYTIVTQDSDFNNLNILFGFPPKIIWIRTGNLSTSSIVGILVSYKGEIKEFTEDKNYGCFEILKLK